MLIEVYFTEDGERETRILGDRGRLVSLQVTQQDIDDAIGMQPFVLTTEELPSYKIKYKGKERIDELARRFAPEELAAKVADCYEILRYIEAGVNEKLVFEQLLFNLASSDRMSV